MQRLVRVAKKRHYKRKVEKLKKQNPKQWWDYINKELGRKKTTQPRIQIDGVTEEMVAETLNQHFVRVWTSTSSSSNLSLPPVTGDEELCSIGLLKQALKKLNPQKS